jgi:uncharacterized protein (TIGR03435 family)
MRKPAACLALGLPVMFIAAAVGLAEPQESKPPAQALAFEVASVRPAAEPGRVPMFCIIPCAPGERLSVEGSRVDIRYMSLYQLIVRAYRIKLFHQLTGPDWMRSQRFDIMAKIPEGVSKDRVPEMLQNLLAERFKLSIHFDHKEQPVYALIVGKNGSKLREASADADASVPASPGDRTMYSGQGDARMLEGGNVVVTGGTLGPIQVARGTRGLRMEFSKLTMGGLTELLAPHEDHPVVDMTNLRGTYVFVWEDNPPLPPEGGSGERGGKRSGPPDGGRSGGDSLEAGPPRDPLGDSLFAAIEKAGLKLESRKAPVEVIVVDHLEKTPTEN